MLTVPLSTISNSQVFLLKNVSSLCECKSYSCFFSAKILAYMPIFNDQSFKDTLTNDIVSFEQLGPDHRKGYQVTAVVRNLVSLSVHESVHPQINSSVTFSQGSILL